MSANALGSVPPVAIRYMQVLGVTVMLLENFEVFEEEIELIWKTRWTAIKMLYLITRYLPYFELTLDLIYYASPVALSPSWCLINLRFTTWLGLLGIAFAELILMVRTYAIYDSSRRVAIFFAVIYLSWAPAGLYATNVFTNSFSFDDPPPELHGLPGCYMTKADPVLFGYLNYGALISFEFICIIMTLSKTLQHVKRAQGRLRFENHIMAILTRDAVLYFVTLFLFTLLNMIMPFVGPPGYYDLFFSITRVLHSVLCCRIVLNMRSAAGPFGHSRRRRRSESIMPRFATVRSSQLASVDARFGGEYSIGQTEDGSVDDSVIQLSTNV